jgi:hypothetical protein
MLGITMPLRAQDSQPATEPASRPDSSPDEPPTRRPSRRENPLKDAVAQLTAEALRCRKDQKLAASKPDFAARFSAREQLDLSQLSKAMLSPAHRDPFVDAYVRWQLTSFDPALPPLDERAFVQFIEALPAMVENPAGDAEAMAAFEQVDEKGVLTPGMLKRYKEAEAELRRRGAVAEALNVPAEGLRDWILAQVGSTGALPRLLLLERCAATVRAGWSAGKLKGDVTREFTASTTDGQFKPDQRALVAAYARHLAGTERRIIKEITFMADGSLRVSFETPRISEQDAEKWIDRLHGGKSR